MTTLPRLRRRSASLTASLALAIGACAAPMVGNDAGDAAMDRSAADVSDADDVLSRDVPTPPPDATADDAIDSAVDSGPDAMDDAMDDAAMDAAMDAVGPDVASDTRIDVVSDTRSDTGADVVDARTDTGIDAPDARSPASIVQPRQLWPLSGSSLSTSTPVLRWSLPSGTTGGFVTLCRDRAMTMGCLTTMAVGASVTAPSLATGMWFWNVRGRAASMTGTPVSPTWQFRVRGAFGRNTAWGAQPDFNGDGLSDLVVGALRNGFAGGGATTIYNGRPSGPSATPSRTLTGMSADDSFGSSVCSAGDVNGDGFMDLFVGARLADPGGLVDAGTVFIYYGTPTGVAATPSFTISGARAGERIGYASTAAGDVNGDGYADLLISAHRSSPGGIVDAGSARLYLGQASVGMIPSTTLDGTVVNGQFSASMTGIGDVNGDGFDDVAIAAFNEGAGAVRVYRGAAGGLDPTPVQTMTGTRASEGFGWTVGNAGDVNRDGYADLFVTAYFAGGTMGLVEPGTASIYHGNGTMFGARAALLEGTTSRELFGAAAAGVGDVNGDGYDDLVVGAHFADPMGRTDAGRAYVYRGGAAGLSTTVNTSWIGDRAGASFGAAVTGGDLNGDGRSEVVVAAPRINYGAGRVGSFSVFSPDAMGALPATPTSLVNGTTAEELLGIALPF